MKTVGIIPARYSSTRLPGKPLIDICGHPMIWWVYHRTLKAKKISEIYVATDDIRIEKVCRENNIPVLMTVADHTTAANRLYEVSKTVDADLYIQINGDEPLISTDAITAAIPEEVCLEREFGTNVITEIENTAELMDSSNIKVVFDEDMNARDMSRNPIPYPYKSINFKYYKHVGIISYNKKMLEFYANSEPGRFEKIEGIDTLRFIDYGKQLRLVYVPHCFSFSVDTEKDLEIVRERLMHEER